jgi:hypothetical protein
LKKISVSEVFTASIIALMTEAVFTSETSVYFNEKAVIFILATART